MTVRLPNHLNLIATAPAGIQKLRGLILELAVRGKLVAQDPNDEPASELLKRIAQERARLETEGTCKKSKATPLDDNDAPPFQLPTGWELSQLSDLTLVLNGRAYSKDELLSEGVPVLRVGNLFTSNHWYYSNLQLEDDKYCDQGDLLYSWSASFGPFIWQGPKVIYHYHIWKLRLFDESSLSKEFFYKFLLEKTAEIKAAGHGVSMIHMTKEKMEKILVPVPPLAEQHHIVAKVDELMALCDRLEAEQTDAGAAHTRLVATLLGTLTQSADAAELAANWQRLAEHFDTLFTTESSLDALKQTILQLAVMGKLVPQDPNDEPVERTFPGLRALNAIPTVGADVPMKWALCPYRSITSLVTSGSRGWKEWYSDTGAIFIRTQNIKTDNLVLDDVAFVDLPETTEGMRTQVLKDDILITITGANVTKAALIENEIPRAYVSQHIALTRPRWSAMSRWLHLCFISHGSARGTLERLAYGAKPGLNLNNIRDLEMPIPPLAEQHRIVAKVDELLALCERLKADLAESRAQQERLAATLIESALQAA